MKKPKIFAHCIEIYFPKQIMIKPAENVTVKAEIKIVLSGNFTGILIPIADFHTFKTKCDNIVKGRQKLDFNFLKSSFSKTFRFKRRGQLRILILINTKQNENFKFVHNFAE